MAQPIAPWGAIRAIVLLVGAMTLRLLAADPVTLGSGAVALQFAADGKPRSFVVAGQELLDRQDPGPGFEVHGYAFNYQRPTSFRLQNLALQGRLLTASVGEDVRVTWETTVTDRFLAFRLVRVEGLPKANRLTLSFSMHLAGPARVVALGPMTTLGAKGCSVAWPWLWQRTAGADLGGFALLVPGADEVQGFQALWQDLHLDRPAANEPWDAAACERWFARHRQGFAPSLPAAAERSAATGPAIAIGSPALGLHFTAAGRPGALLSRDRNLLPAADPGAGFTLQRLDPLTGAVVTVPSRSLAWAPGRLTMDLANGARAVFQVTASDRFLAFRLIAVDGFSSPDLEWLQFRLNIQGKYRLTALDYMTEVNPNVCIVTWPWLWKRRPGAPLGGFALSLPKDDADADETLLHLWVEAGLPHPRVKGAWDLAMARAWLAEWQRQFADQSQMLITAKSNDDLYSLADAAAGMGMRRIYMHTDTWNGEYWPVKYSFIHLNPQVFPGGEPDFQRFAAYAKDKGIGLTIHTVSASIANADPDYVVGTIDPRLATWIRGTLEAPVGPKDRTLRFRPAPGGEMPLHLDRPVTGPAHVDPWNNIKTVRLGDEFVRVGRFTDTDQEVWTLTDCTRGAYKTAAVDHAPATAIAGMIRPYDQVFTADNDTTLVEELGRRTAEFNNRNNIIHCEQDAGEVHTVNHPWGYARFAEAVYTNLDHPVTSNNSGGSSMPCQVEYRFTSSKAITAQHHQPQVPLTVAREGRPATSPYEMPSLVAKAVAKGATSIGLHKPEPMFGVSPEILREYGLTELAKATVVDWKAVASRLGDDQRAAILATDDQVIHRAARTPAGLQVTPLRLLARPGIDIGWKAGSEFGPIVPRQYLPPGGSLAVQNPWAAQEPEFILRVMNGIAEAADAAPIPTIPSATPKKLSEQEQAALDGYNLGAGLKPTAAGDRGPSQVIAKDIAKSVIQPKVEALRNLRDHRIQADGDGLRIRFENPRNEAIVLDDDGELPSFPCTGDMSAARGLGLTVVGDGSGAVLVLRAHFRGHRDYIVPIDFTGPRDIVIPCGEVSWADARWGWRMASKGAEYGKLNRMDMGFGKIPAKSAPEVRVSRLRILPEVPVRVTDPEIRIGDGSLRIQGAIASESYLWYQGGPTIGVYDLNWRKRADLPVVKQGFIAPTGPMTITVASPGGSILPWLECQFFVKGAPMDMRP